MESVGNSITETAVAMELCKEVQVEEYVIHVVGSTNFYTQLQFSLLASTWFPRPLGVCLWSALHMLLVLFKVLVILILFLTVFVLAVLWDVLVALVFIYFDLARHISITIEFLIRSLGVALSWLWLVITCQFCTLPGRAPRQGLGQYIFTAGGTLGTPDPQPAGVMEGGPCPFLKEGCNGSITLRFVRHVILVSFPYWRAQLGDLCREIVPWCDTIVI